MKSERWLLPEGFDEVLPPQAENLERLRRDILDLYRGWGYELVMPPFIEYIESLLTGTGRDLDLQTFKVTDKLTGRLMGLRADMTPQAARIDAHQLRRERPTRLCYLGTVVRTVADGFAGSRSPLQTGAELYGHAGVESDVEVLRLMLETLALNGIREPYLDLGHVGIYRGLARQAGLGGDEESVLFDALQRKAQPEIDQLLDEFRIQQRDAEMLSRLAELNGDDAIARARQVFAGADPVVLDALDYLERLASMVRRLMPEVPLHFDLAELRGYHFHTGAVFAAFVPESGQEVARGGRYDDIGRVFGRARPATGFSADLKVLTRLGDKRDERSHPPGGIFAPWVDDRSLHEQVRGLRAQGHRVIFELPGQTGGPRQMGCTQELRLTQGTWTLVDLT